MLRVRFLRIKNKTEAGHGFGFERRSSGMQLAPMWSE